MHFYEHEVDKENYFIVIFIYFLFKIPVLIQNCHCYIATVWLICVFSYGDKVPRSVGGRLFGVVWINVGLVILAIYMGIITASLSTNSIEQANNIYGMPVSQISSLTSFLIKRGHTLQKSHRVTEVARMWNGGGIQSIYALKKTK